MNANNLLTVRNLKKFYGNQLVLDQPLFDFSSGVYCLFGPNGTGKSTWLAILGGADTNYRGEIHFQEREFKKSRYELNFLRSYLQDKPEFYPGLTGRDFFGLLCTMRKFDFNKTLSRAVEIFKIQDFLHLPLNQLSLGQRKRIFLGLTLILQLPLWILDEPSNGLDQESCSAIIQLINENRHNHIIIMSSHDESFIRETKAQRIEMKKGRSD